MAKQAKRVLLIVPGTSTQAIPKNEEFADRLRANLDGELELETCSITELFFELDQQKIAIYHPKKQFDLRDFDLVVMRFVSGLVNEAHAIAQYCQHFGIRYTDEYLDRLMLDSKMSTQFALWRQGVKNWPKTFYGDLYEMLRRFDECGGRAVLKDDEGRKGRLNFLVHSPGEIKRLHDENPGTRFVLQEFIPNSSDVRVLVLNEKPVLVIERKGCGDSHLNNTSQGAQATLLGLDEIDEETLEMCVAAARHAKLQAAGVDVMFDSRDATAYLLEVNSAPQISSGAFMEEKAKAYGEMLKELAG